MIRTAATCLLLALGLGSRAQQVSITYRWLNLPCAANINCTNACSACDLPDVDGSLLFGSNTTWTGVEVCPHPVSPIDNALHTDGWPAAPSGLHHGIVEAMATAAMRLDSIVLRHRSSPGGPQRLRISLLADPTMPWQELADTDVSELPCETVVATAINVEVNPQDMLATFKLRLQAYEGGEGSWQLDELRIVATPAENIGAGIGDIVGLTPALGGRYYDVLGRPVREGGAAGVYTGPKRVVVME